MKDAAAVIAGAQAAEAAAVLRAVAAGAEAAEAEAAFERIQEAAAAEALMATVIAEFVSVSSL